MDWESICAQVNEDGPHMSVDHFTQKHIKFFRPSKKQRQADASSMVAQQQIYESHHGNHQNQNQFNIDGNQIIDSYPS